MKFKLLKRIGALTLALALAFSSIPGMTALASTQPLELEAANDGTSNTNDGSASQAPVTTVSPEYAALMESYDRLSQQGVVERPDGAVVTTLTTVPGMENRETEIATSERAATPAAFGLRALYSFDPNLQHALPPADRTPDYAFIPCSGGGNGGTIYKIDFSKGNERVVGIYRSENTSSQPRRVAYDQNKNAWIANISTSGNDGHLTRILSDTSSLTNTSKESALGPLSFAQEQATQTFVLNGQRNPRAVLFDREGHLWVGGSHEATFKEYQIDEANKKLILLRTINVGQGFLGTYTAIFDKNGDLFITNYDGASTRTDLFIVKLAEQGRYPTKTDFETVRVTLKSTSNGNVVENNIYGVSCDPTDGSVWVGGYLSGVIYRYYKGVLQTFIPPQNAQYTAIEAGGGYVYTTAYNGNYVARMKTTPNSSGVYEWESNIATNSSHGLFVLDDRLVVVGTGTNTLQVHDLNNPSNKKVISVGITPYVYGAFITRDLGKGAEISGKAIFQADGNFSAASPSLAQAGNIYEVFKLYNTAGVFSVGEKVADAKTNATGEMLFTDLKQPHEYANSQFMRLMEGNYIIKQVHSTLGRPPVFGGVLEGGYVNEFDSSLNGLKFSVKNYESIKVVMGHKGTGISIKGNVWLDHNVNGLKDSEPAYTDSTVELTLYRDDSGVRTKIVTVKPSASGEYDFPHVEPGKYVVAVEGSSLGRYALTTGIGADNKFNSVSKESNFVTVNLLAGVHDVDLGLIYTDIKAGGSIFIDSNFDGLKAGESSYNGTDIKFTLVRVSDGKEISTVTSSSSQYSFTNVQPGEYYVKAELLNSQTVITDKVADNKFRDSDNRTANFTVGTSNNLTQDLGIITASAVSIVEDGRTPTGWTNKNVTVNFKITAAPKIADATVDGTPTASLNGSRTATGSYEFTSNKAINVTATNSVGGNGSATLVVDKIDRTAPKVAITLPADKVITTAVLNNPSNVSFVNVASPDNKTSPLVDATKKLYIYKNQTDTTPFKVIEWSNLSTELPQVPAGKYYITVSIRDEATNYGDSKGGAWTGPETGKPDPEKPEGPGTGPVYINPDIPAIDEKPGRDKTTWTNQDVTINYNAHGVIPFSSLEANGSNVSGAVGQTNYNGSFVVTHNTTASGSVTNEAGKVGNVPTPGIVVTNIDKLKPVITLPASGKVTDTNFTIEDATATALYGKSGVNTSEITVIRVVNGSETIFKYGPYASTTAFFAEIVAKKIPSGTYNIYVKSTDNATNVSEAVGKNLQIDGGTTTPSGDWVSLGDITDSIPSGYNVGYLLQSNDGTAIKAVKVTIGSKTPQTINLNATSYRWYGSVSDGETITFEFTSNTNSPLTLTETYTAPRSTANLLGGATIPALTPPASLLAGITVTNTPAPTIYSGVTTVTGTRVMNALTGRVLNTLSAGSKVYIEVKTNTSKLFYIYSGGKITTDVNQAKGDPYLVS